LPPLKSCPIPYLNPLFLQWLKKVAFSPNHITHIQNINLYVIIIQFFNTVKILKSFNINIGNHDLNSIFMFLCTSNTKTYKRIIYSVIKM